MLGVDDSVQPKLARHEEPDIDQLVPKVEKVMKAFAICKEHLDAFRRRWASPFSRRMGRRRRRSGLGLRAAPVATGINKAETAATRKTSRSERARTFGGFGFSL
jgi:hypothetical protein